MDTIIITVVTAVFASTGFWAFVTGFLDRKSAQKELLVAPPRLEDMSAEAAIIVDTVSTIG